MAKTWTKVWTDKLQATFCGIHSLNLEQIIAYADLMAADGLELDEGENDPEKIGAAAFKAMDEIQVPITGPFPPFIQEKENAVSHNTSQHSPQHTQTRNKQRNA